MNFHRSSLVVALALALPLGAAFAQTAKPATAAASKPLVVTDAPTAPVKAKPDPRRMSPTEARNTAVLPGELKPDGSPTQPQLNLSLGKRPNDPVSAKGKTRSAVDDTAGRCAAIADEQERAMCRERAGLPPAKPAKKP